MMRNLRHPIAAFALTVLIVVGIGVGILAVTQTSKVYGPPEARFTVAFPGRVQEQRVGFHAVTTVAYDSSVIYEGQNPALHGRSAVEASVSAQHVSDALYRYALREMALGLKGKGALAVPLPGKPREQTEQVNGFLFFRLGPLCAPDIGQTFCEGVLVVARNGTIWTLSATSFLGLDPVAAFLDSFQPIG